MFTFELAGEEQQYVDEGSGRDPARVALAYTSTSIWVILVFVLYRMARELTNHDSAIEAPSSAVMMKSKTS